MPADQDSPPPAGPDGEPPASSYPAFDELVRRGQPGSRAQPGPPPPPAAAGMPPPYDLVPPSEYQVLVPASQSQVLVPLSQYQVKPKRPWLAALVSVLLPGVGSMMSEELAVGTLILVLYALGWIFAFFWVGIPVLVGAWIWGVVHAHRSARRWNQRHGIAR